MTQATSLLSVTSESPSWLRRFGLLSFVGASFLHLLSLGILFWFVHSRDEVVILRYNAYLGIDLLGAWWQLFLVPAVTYFFVLMNLILIHILNRRGYREIALLLALGNWFISVAGVIVAIILSLINV